MSGRQAPDDTQLAVSLAAVVSGESTDHFIMTVIPGNPPTKDRPRVGRGGKVYHDPQAKAAERRTGRFIRDAVKGRPFTGNVGVACVFVRADRRIQDVDNMLKHVCDASNKIAWADDSQVTAMLGIVEYDPANPRTVVVFTHHDSTMRRGTDDVIPCKGCSVSIDRRTMRLYCNNCTPQRKAL